MKKLVLILASLLWQLAAPAFGQIALVNYCQTTGRDCTGDFTGSNILLVLNGGNTPQDSNGNTYTQIAAYNNPGYVGTYLWASFNPTITSGMTWTYTGFSYDIAGFSGVYGLATDINSPVNGDAGDIVLGPATPSLNNELVLGVAAWNEGTGTVTGNMTRLGPDSQGSPLMLYTIQTTAASSNATISMNSPQTVGYNGVLVSLYSSETPPPLKITTSSLASGEQNVNCTSTVLAAQGGTPPYTFSLDPSSPALPAGCAVNADGSITGPATTSGTFSGLIFDVTDAASTVAQSSPLSLYIYRAPPPSPGPPSILGETTTQDGNTSAPIDTHGATLILAATAGSAPTDSENNTWTKIAFINQPGYISSNVYAVFQPTTSLTHTFTGNFATTIMAIANVASGPDQSATATGLIMPNVTPSLANEFVYSFLSNQVDSTFTSSPLTLSGQVSDDNGPNTSSADAYQVQTTATTVGNTWTVSSSNSPLGGILTFYSTETPGPLSVATTSLPEQVSGNACSIQLVAEGGDQPYHWTLHSGALPSGVTLNDNGTFSCSDTTSGVTTGLVFQVTDSQASPATALSPSLTLPIAASALTITTTSCPSGKQLTAYAGCAINITGGFQPYSLADTILPEGLTSTCSGASCSITSSYINGQGNYAPTFQATDLYNAVATQTITFSIDGDNTFGGHQIFAGDSIWHLKLDGLPVAPGAFAAIYTDYQGDTLKWLGGQDAGGNGGIPINTFPSTEPFIPNSASSMFTTIPVDCFAAMENGRFNSYGGQDNHVISIILDSNGAPAFDYEMYQTNCTSEAAGWFGLPDSDGNSITQPPNVASINSYGTLTPDSGNVVDAAGLPLAPLILNYDEVAGGCSEGSECGTVQHPIRFTLPHSLFYMVPPATGAAGYGGGSCSGGGTDNSQRWLTFLNPPTNNCGGDGTPGSLLNPMGETFRVKSNVAMPTACLPPSMGGTGDNQTYIIATALYHYGIILADNGNYTAIIATPDPRWDADSTINGCLNSFTFADFEGVTTESALATPWTSTGPNSSRITVIDNIRLSGTLKLQGSAVLQ